MSARVHRLLVAALEDRLGPLDNLSSSASPWVSLTFEGLRHRLEFGVTLCDAFDRAAAATEAIELDLGPHFLASLSLRRDGERGCAEALTILA